jgi:two-component system phosphate regulon sensor histidine kinase PhoR
VLIDDVLMLSRLDEGVEEESYPIDLASICQRVVIRLEPTANAHGAKVNITCKEPVYATGYEMLAEQAVYNLVDNALRYGGGEVEIDLSTSGDMARITISDNGHGVPEGMRERIFERFFRLDTSRSRSTGGTGLGLAIVKHAAEVMGGSVSVTDSSLGGASFMVTLPKANGVEASRPRPDS